VKVSGIEAVEELTVENKVKIGIIGAAGYTAGELLRILAAHPYAQVVFAQSESNAGNPVWQVHQDLYGETDMSFVAEAPVGQADVLFLCSGHGRSKGFVHSLPEDFSGKIIDLSNDFRLADEAEGFVYGLPEAFRAEIAKSSRIANPGCFATAIQLALLPLANAGRLTDVHLTGVTGSTGAGQKPSETTHFSWRADNLSVYKPFTHQHIGEILQTLHRLSVSWQGSLDFIPIRGCLTRGILVSAYMRTEMTEDEAASLYREYYAAEPFVQVTDMNPDIKMVTNTNKCLLNVRKYGDNLHIISVIDNLVKGASGQAVQNMNLMCGFPETAGLRLKSNRF